MNLIDKIRSIDWKARFHNKVFLAAFISGIIMVIKSLGIVTIPDNWDVVLNTILTFCVGIGIIVDTSTKGIQDNKKAVFNKAYLLKKSEDDERDLIHDCSAGTIPSALKTEMDLRPKMPPVFDQLDIGACTGNAGVAARMTAGPTTMKTMLSRLILYYEERAIEGNIPVDSGATIRSICKALYNCGVCEESYYPYNVLDFTKAPSPEAVANALKYKIKSYKALKSIIDIKIYMSVYRKPVLMGMFVYDSFESIAVAKTGKVPVPNDTKENLLGGHAVLIVGYKDTKKTLFNKSAGYFIVRNSWGPNWGDKGYFYLPYEFFTKGFAFDFWTIQV